MLTRSLLGDDLRREGTEGGGVDERGRGERRSESVRHLGTSERGRVGGRRRVFFWMEGRRACVFLLERGCSSKEKFL